MYCRVRIERANNCKLHLHWTSVQPASYTQRCHSRYFNFNRNWFPGPLNITTGFGIKSLSGFHGCDPGPQLLNIFFTWSKAFQSTELHWKYIHILEVSYRHTDRQTTCTYNICNIFCLLNLPFSRSGQYGHEIFFSRCISIIAEGAIMDKGRKPPTRNIIGRHNIDYCQYMLTFTHLGTVYP